MMADSTVFENGGGAQDKVKKYPKFIDMLMEALREGNDNPRKGTSVMSVKKWIGANYPDAKLGVHLKNAFTKALAMGLIERPKDQADYTTVLSGRYKLPKPPKPARVRTKKVAELKPKKTTKQEIAAEIRGRSTSPKKVTGKTKSFPRARARSVSATPRASKSKRVRSRLSKSHSPLRTPKLIKPKTKSVAGKKKTTTSPAAKKAAAAAKPTKKSAAKAAVTSPETKPAAKTSKKPAKVPVKAAKTTKGGKAAAGKDAPKKKK